MATTTELNYQTSYNRELILDLTLEAFSVYSFDHDDEDADAPKVHAYIPVGKEIKTDAEDVVLDNSGNIVVDGSGNNVTVTVKTSSNRTTDSRRESFKFLTTQGTSITISEYRDYTFTDWVSYDGTGFDFSSYALSGYNISDDFMRKKQAIYIIVHSERTEYWYTLSGADVVLARQSSCLVQAQWDFNISADQGKWGTQFEAYRLMLPQPASPSAGDNFDYGPRVITTKNKLRGSGDALSILFQSSTGKDMKLLGWGLLGYKVDNP
jgi:hypothetical protein